MLRHMNAEVASRHLEYIIMHVLIREFNLLEGKGGN